MKNKRLLLVGVLALSGCATQSMYWHENPQLSVGAGTVQGVWQGMVRNQALLSYQRTKLNSVARVRCDQYADRVSVEVSGDQLRVKVGREHPLVLLGSLQSNGYFQVDKKVEGDTSIYGGVPIFTHQPMLTVEGRLNPQTGIGEGVMLTAPKGSSVGCYSSFQVALGAAPVPESQLGESFKIKYWIDDKSDYEKVFDY